MAESEGANYWAQCLTASERIEAENARIRRSFAYDRPQPRAT